MVKARGGLGTGAFVQHGLYRRYPGTCNEKCTIITTRNRRADAFKPTCYLLIFTGELVS